MPVAAVEPPPVEPEPEPPPKAWWEEKAHWRQRGPQDYYDDFEDVPQDDDDIVF